MKIRDGSCSPDTEPMNRWQSQNHDRGSNPYDRPNLKL